VVCAFIVAIKDQIAQFKNAKSAEKGIKRIVLLDVVGLRTLGFAQNAVNLNQKAIMLNAMNA
jgi:hypothetical protein